MGSGSENSIKTLHFKCDRSPNVITVAGYLQCLNDANIINLFKSILADELQIMLCFVTVIKITNLQVTIAHDFPAKSRSSESVEVAR